MVVNSDANLNLYPENRPFKFCTYLQTPLVLKSKWKVAIIDIKLSQGQQSQDLYVHSDICDETIVDGSAQPLLKRICANTTAYTEFKHLNYVSVTKNEIRDIEFYITDIQGRLASVVNESVSLTLHFKSYPFFLA